jgi:hypothetical protein
MCFPLRDALREWFVQAVTLIFIALLPIDCAFVEFKRLFVTELLLCVALCFLFCICNVD